ncbi:MAG: hypothetical protein DRI97_15545 [Bacteroidetes bacterium]|nr:MAG: hypothetical protein DRI97_15545 [Bacteroidota bacterium]
MVNQTSITCSKCKEKIAYIPGVYAMSCQIICVKCGDKPSRRKKTKQSNIATAASNYARVRGGIRKDIHPTYFFRSPWEANVARVFELIEATWEFEGTEFLFKDYNTSPYKYIMDFEVTKALKSKQKDYPIKFEKAYYEVKGWMDPKSRNKMRRYKKNYPQQAANTIMIINRDKLAVKFCEKSGFRYMFYHDVEKIFKPLIPNWEGR